MNNELRHELQTGDLNTLKYHLQQNVLGTDELTCILLNIVRRLEQLQNAGLPYGYAVK